MIAGRLLQVMDYETDKFKKKRIPKPFTVGVFDGETCTLYWGDDAVGWFIWYMRKQRASVVYAHNGGGFDFMFMREWWSGEPTIINTRIAKVEILHHEFRDSLKLLPVALATLGGKKEIDYDKMERRVREKNRAEILEYLQADCIALYAAIMGFIEEFGYHLTIGSAAIRALREFHSYEALTPGIDAIIRPYFFGGRNQCFDAGELHGNWKVYDVNSMYPYVMKNFKHPIGPPFCFNNRITKRTAFIKLQARNFGALPMRDENNSLDFTRETGEFNCTIHELNAGLETGTLEPLKIISTVDFKDWSTFGEFVDVYYAKRKVAIDSGNKMRTVFYKQVLVNSWGKFATNPENFRDYTITDETPSPRCNKDCRSNCGKCWEVEGPIADDFYLWKKPSDVHPWHFHNVATGASITGAARATLLRALAVAVRPVYCDTDSIICERLNLELDPSKLGAWKTEGEGDLVAIAGKKTYCVMNGKCTHSAKERCDDDKTKKPAGCAAVKIASKGADLSPEEIRAVARGDEVEYANPVPKFKLSGKVIFTERTIRRTTKGVHGKIGKR